MIHKIKCWRPYFEEVASGKKPFEVRKDDRGYNVGDLLVIQEWDHIAAVYTGREVSRKIISKLKGGQFGIEDGYCVLGLEQG